MPAQLPLALRFPPDQRFDTFVESGPAVVAPLRTLRSGPAQGLLIVGPGSAGKTHLALATCAEMTAAGLQVAYLPLASAAGRLRPALEGLERHHLVALDGVEAVASQREDETALFDFHNRMHDAGRSLLYTARTWPDALGLALPDLRSRLEQCTRIALVPLDDAGRAAMLRLRAARRGLHLAGPAIDWLLQRADRDPASLTALFDRLDAASLAAQRRITVPFLRRTLGIGGPDARSG